MASGRANAMRAAPAAWGEEKASAGTSSPCSGRLGFEAYYGSVFGDRWAALSQAMRVPTTKVGVWNKLCRFTLDEYLTAAAAAYGRAAAAD